MLLALGHRLSQPIRRAGLIWVLVLVACGGGEAAAPAPPPIADAGWDQDTADADASAETETGEADAPHEGGEAAAPDPCVDAQELPVVDQANGTVNPAAGESAYYRFSLAAGTTTGFESYAIGNVSALVDPVLTLLDESGTSVLATNAESSSLAWSNGYPSNIYGSAGELYTAGRACLIVFRAPEDMTACLRVEDRTTWLGAPAEAKPPLQYALFVAPIDESLACIDTEPNDTASTAQPTDDCMRATSNFGSRTLAVSGMMDANDDVDVFRVPVSDDSGLVDLAFDPPGPGGPGVAGSGSTLALESVELTDEAGTVYARADAMLGVKELYAYMPKGQDALLWIRRAPGSTVGSNDYYFLSGGVMVPDLLNKFGERETAAGENDTPDTAEIIEPGIDSITAVVEYVAAGFINETAPGEPVDVDYWAVQGFPGGSIVLRCWSARVGSGVIDPTYAIVDAQGNVLREGVETKDRDFAWRDDPLAVAPPLTLPTGDTYYLRVTAAGQDPDVLSRAYVCGVDALLP